MFSVRPDAFVDGAWRDSPRRFAVVDPATGDELARVAELDDAAVDDAIAAAARALPAWRARPATERAASLARIAERMRADERALGALITAEQGKPLAEAIAEIRYAASFFDWFAGEATRIYGETIPASRADQRITVTREPVGVCGLITPWNFPAAMLARKLGPALAAGCTVVAKPAEATPLTALALAQIAADAGVPAGVINIVTGEDAARIAGRMLASRDVRKIGFTGSTRVGRELMRGCADDLKRLSLELGGNAPFIVFDDADVERAIRGAMVAKYRNAGQSCVAANRFLVARAIADRFVDGFIAASAALVVGRGSEPTTTIGPLIDRRAADNVRRRIDDALARGARRVIGANGDGPFVHPTILVDVTRDMAVWREEIFGPVAPITLFDDEAEAIALANDTDAGLVAFAYTRDAARRVRVTDALAAGMIGIDEGLVSTAQAPFGGIKHSGFGREGSRHGIDDYTELKYVMTGL